MPLKEIKEIAKSKEMEVFSFPVILGFKEFNELLIWSSDLGCSDIVLKTGEPVYLRINGKWLVVGTIPIKNEELAVIVNEISRSNSTSTMILNGEDMDFAHEIRVSRTEKVRFRCNATASSFKSDVGVSLTLRTIPSTPPSLKDLNVEPELLEDAFIDKGLVLVTGVMGSGKSTLLAAILREIIQTENKNIITYESPIEFDLVGLDNKKSLVQQTEVPTHLKGGFADAIRNSTRRAADIILVGEARDTETFRKMLEAADIGTAAYSTLHTRSVSETVTRIINEFPNDERNQIASTLIASARLIIQQRLVPRADKPGRVPLKEYLGFSRKIKKALANVKTEDLAMKIQEFVESDGQSLLFDATRKFEEGLIFEEDYLSIKREFSSE